MSEEKTPIELVRLDVSRKVNEMLKYRMYLMQYEDLDVLVRKAMSIRSQCYRDVKTYNYLRTSQEDECAWYELTKEQAKCIGRILTKKWQLDAMYGYYMDIVNKMSLGVQE